MHATRWREAAAHFVNRYLVFERRGDVVRLAVTMMAVFALAALWRGQDSNWDLRNYHLYNPYAWLHGRLAIDLAPAQMQSYFIPWMDVPYFFAAQHWPRMTGMALGAFHGLVFVLVAGISWQVLGASPQRRRLAPLLALAGCGSAVFLSELGNTMGDNTTAVFVLAALLCVTTAVTAGDGRARSWWLAGGLLGLGVGLKLTNAMYALALGAAVLSGPWPWRQRVARAWHLTVATTLAATLVAGPWLWQVWRQFGNPLFPQFNGWFQSPMAQPISVADQRFQASSWGEALIRPLQFTANPLEISEAPMIQIIWAVLYIAAIVWGIAAWRRRGMSTQGADVANGALRVLMVFFVVAFVIWSAMFSIHRYLVVLELLAPLVLWRMIVSIAPQRGRHVAGWLIVACVIAALAGRQMVTYGWGNSGWAPTAFQVQAPDMPQPSSATVLLVGGEPQAWRVPFMPPEAMYASVASNLPESARFVEVLHERMARRGGTVYAMLPAASDSRGPRRQAKIDRVNALAAFLRIDRGECTYLRQHARNRGAQIAIIAFPDGPRCRLTLPANSSGRDLVAENAELARVADTQLARYALAIAPGSCRSYESSIGAEAFPYQWCQVVRRP